MVFRINVLSDKIENFALHIDADEKNTFFELHEVIQNECKFDPSQLATFFLADEEWDKGPEIKMFGDNSPGKTATLTMKDTILGDYLKVKEDKFIYDFDVINQKSLYLELIDIFMEDKLNTPVVTYNRGIAPVVNPSNRNDKDLLANEDAELHNIFTDFGELEDLNMIYGEIGEVM